MKRIFGILLSVALIACFAVSGLACGGNDDENNGGNDASDTVKIFEVGRDLKDTEQEALVNFATTAYNAWFRHDEGDTDRSELVSAEYVSHEVKEETDVGKLPDYLASDVVSAQECEVTYNVIRTYGFNDAVTVGDPIRIVHDIYLLKYSDGKYGWALGYPKAGERIPANVLRNAVIPAHYIGYIGTAISSETKTAASANGELAFAGAYELKNGFAITKSVVYGDETRFKNRTPGHGDLTTDSLNYDIEGYIYDEDDAQAKDCKTAVKNWGKGDWEYATADGYTRHNFIEAVFSEIFDDFPGVFITVTETGENFTCEGTVVTEVGDETVTRTVKFTCDAAFDKFGEITYTVTRTDASGTVTSKTVTEIKVTEISDADIDVAADVKTRFGL